MVKNRNTQGAAVLQFKKGARCVRGWHLPSARDVSGDRYMAPHFNEIVGAMY